MTLAATSSRTIMQKLEAKTVTLGTNKDAVIGFSVLLFPFSIMAECSDGMIGDARRKSASGGWERGKGWIPRDYPFLKSCSWFFVSLS